MCIYLEVKVDNVLGVCVAHSLQNLLHIVGGLPFIEKVLLSQVVKQLSSMKPACACVCANKCHNEHKSKGGGGETADRKRVGE